MDRVVLGALVRDGHILLAQRSHHKHAYPGVWDLPGGVVEAGESEVEALARELEEELGVQVSTASLSLLGRVVAGPAGEPAEISAWLVRSWRGEAHNIARDEHEAIRWVDIAALPPLLHSVVHQELVRLFRGQADSAVF